MGFFSKNSDFEETDRQQRHNSRIVDIAFNPTADLIATCSNEANVYITSYKAGTAKIGII